MDTVWLERWKENLAKKLPKSPLTYVLFCMFGIGSWVAINGIWAEISLLVITLPECDKLPAVLVVVIQVANIGPLVYSIIKYCLRMSLYKQLYLEIVTVYVLVCIGLASCVLLAIFWSETAHVFGSPHSVALIALTFTLAIVDCTSSLVFLPFMKHFPAEYISGLYIGEGLSGVLPSIVALSQGFVNNSLKCLGEYPGHSFLGIHFSPNVFFVFLAIMMLLSGLAFLGINVLPMVRKQMIVSPPYFKVQRPSFQSEEGSPKADAKGENLSLKEEKSDNDPQENKLDDSAESPLIGSPEAAPDEEEEETQMAYSDESSAPHSRALRHVLKVFRTNLTVLVSLAVVNFLTNGALAAISAYAFGPYGNTVYHVAINLALLAAPIAALVYAFLSHKSRRVIVVLTTLSCILGIYVLVAALMSPQPPLQNNVGGKILIVLVNVAISAIVSYTKVGAVVQLHTNNGDRDTALLLAGVAFQLGSLLGAVLFFLLVYYADIFHYS